MEPSKDTLFELAQAVSDGALPGWETLSDEGLDPQLLSQLEVLVKLSAFHHQETDRRLPEDPETWGPLRILERIGQGGFGEVYRAFDPNLEREVALKLHRLDRGEPRDRKAAILREGRLLAQIRHPNVATVYGADEHDGRVGLWMELIRGKTLEQIVEEQGPYSAREAAVIAVDVCEALAAVHAKGVLHRDVTARNVMRREGGRIMLTDFGLGQSADQPAESGHLRGTPLYMPPEAVLGGTVDFRGDVYSLGVLIYFLVTGAFPVEARDLAELRRAHEERRLRHLRDARPNLPGWFVHAVEAALEPQPEQRCPSVGQLERVLAKGTADIVIEPEPPRKARWAKAAVALVLLVLAALAYWLFQPWAGHAPGDSSLGFAGIVLTDLQSDDDSAGLKGVDNMIRERVADFTFFEAPSHRQISAAAEKIGISVGEEIDASEAAGLAEALYDFPVVIEASLDPLGSRRQLTLEVRRLQDEQEGLRDQWLKRFQFDPGGAPELDARVGAWLGETLQKVKAQVLFLEGSRFNRDGEVDKAIGKLRQALSVDPDFALAQARLGGWLVGFNRFKEGFELEVQALEKLKRIDTPLKEESKARILIFNDIEDYRAAETAAADHVRRFPQDLDGHFYLAFAQAANGDLKEALETYREADRPDGYFALVQTARLHFVNQSYKEAETVISEIAPRRPPDSEEWSEFLRGTLHFLRGDGRKALEAFKFLQKSRVRESQSDYYSATAYVFGELGEFQKALTTLEDGVNHDRHQGLPGFLADKQLARAYVLWRLDRLPELRQICSQESFRTETPHRQAKAGTLLARAGFVQEARQILGWMEAELGEISGTIPISERARHRLRGEIALAEGDAQAALQSFQKAAVVQPAFYDREYLARGLREANRLREALEEYRKSSENPGIFWFLSVNEQYPGIYADTLLDYARLAVPLGEKEQARNALEIYLSMREGADDSLLEEAKSLLSTLSR